MKVIITISFTLLILFSSGCQTTYDAERPRIRANQTAESSIVFVRPDKYSIIGTRSVRDYVEVLYEESELNNAGLLLVSTGLRNKGGQHWYDTKSPGFAISVKATFYDQPLTASGPQSAPLYETNWQTVPMPRGDTAHYSVTCPVPGASYYQLTLSEQL